MNRAEFILAVRERFARVRANFPELVEAMRTCSDQRVLDSMRCGACGGHHITEEEMLAMAEPCDDIEQFLPLHQELFIQRAPRRCRRFLDATERKIQRVSKLREPN